MPLFRVPICSVSKCLRPAEKRGWCGMHYRRWQRHKTTDLLPVVRPSPEERFWEKVNKLGPLHDVLQSRCWLWTGCTNGPGKYGFLLANKEYIFTHRFSYELHIGPIPEGLCVCHRCDNKACVNPDHLFTGTVQDNTDDKVSKNRQLKGEDICQHVLTEPEVREIRRLYRRGSRLLGLASLGRRFGVCMQTISHIVNRTTWMHLS